MSRRWVLSARERGFASQLVRAGRPSETGGIKNLTESRREQIRSVCVKEQSLLLELPQHTH